MLGFVSPCSSDGDSHTRLPHHTPWLLYVPSAPLLLPYPLQFLHSLGARRILVVRPQAVGCMPYVRSLYPKPFPPHCVQAANAVALSVGKILTKVLRKTRRKYRDGTIFEFKWYELWQAAFTRPQAMGECGSVRRVLGLTAVGATELRSGVIKGLAQLEIGVAGCAHLANG